MSRSWVLFVLTCSPARSSAQHEHAGLNSGRGLEELDSASGSSKTPTCSRCGRDGPQDYNCCHPGGAWAGVCIDEGMVARGAANFTYVQGFDSSVRNGQHKQKQNRASARNGRRRPHKSALQRASLRQVVARPFGYDHRCHPTPRNGALSTCSVVSTLPPRLPSFRMLSRTQVAEMPAWGCVWQKATPALCQETSKHVNRAVHAYFNHWGSPSGSDCNGATATGTMLPLFTDVGVAATLAAGLRVAGHNVVRMTPLGTLRMLTIITNRARKPKATKG